MQRGMRLLRIMRLMSDEDVKSEFKGDGREKPIGSTTWLHRYSPALGKRELLYHSLAELNLPRRCDTATPEQRDPDSRQKIPGRNRDPDCEGSAQWLCVGS